MDVSGDDISASSADGGDDLKAYGTSATTSRAMQPYGGDFSATSTTATVEICPQNWDAMKKLLIKQFQVFNRETEVRDRYTSLRQQGNVNDYITRFRALVVELPDESEANQIYQFLKGLKPEIQARTRTHKPKTLLEAMDIADEADRANHHAYKTTSSSSHRDRYRDRDRGSRYGSSSRPEPMQIGAVRAYRSTGQGINEEDDRANGRAKVSAMSAPGPAELQRLRQENRCFYCRKVGHAARDCAKRKADLNRRRPQGTGSRQSRRPAEN